MNSNIICNLYNNSIMTSISSEVIANDKVRQIINSEYTDNDFLELMKEITKDSVKNNNFYKKLLLDTQYKSKEIDEIEDLSDLPYIPASYFKQSANNFRRLLKIPEKSSEFKTWNVSSCTTGDPSLVGRSIEDIEVLASMTIRCIYDFIPIPKEQWDNTLAFNFSPKVSFLNKLAFRYTDVRPVSLYSSNLHKISTRMSNPHFLIKFRFLKAIKEIILRGKLVGAFTIDSKFVIRKIQKNMEKPLEDQKYVSFGGSLQLLNNFMNSYLEDNSIRFDLPNSVVNVGGGGWSGHKSQLKYPPIDKAQFVSDCLDYLGTKKENITDMYGFTETPIVFGSHWSEKYQDFIFHTPPQARIILRDISTQEPLETIGERGFLEVLTPFGVHASINHAILIDDVVELVGTHKCPECGYEGAAFIVYGRIKDQKGLGCSSTVEWI
ncbi:MAG: putative Acyl-protein synthetase, luxE [Promethearchaeota archaeon]|nr:MAG: putative Acyl-protein synthetase, luxE [Candidatus Lokiarchaeota archaeon]